MASLNVEFPDITSTLLLSDDDYMKMLSAAAPVAENAVKRALRQSVRSTDSEVVSSIKTQKPKKARKGSGFSQFIGPSGMNRRNPDGSRRKTPVRNVEVAAYLNYGTKKMSARPWLDKAANNAGKECVEKMQEEFNKRIRS